MRNYDINKCWFVSDLHLSDEHINAKGESRGIRLFERTRFKSMNEHDEYVMSTLVSWGKKHMGETLFILGDFGDKYKIQSLVKCFQKLNIVVIGVKGNHDLFTDGQFYENLFDEYYTMPTFIGKKILVCHEPLYPCPEGIIQIHGHLHTAIIDDPHFICASVHTINYHPIGYKTLQKRFAKIDKVEYRFLTEPYARHLKYGKPRKDLVLNKDKTIDYDASVDLYNSNHTEKKIKNSEKIIKY